MRFCLTIVFLFNIICTSAQFGPGGVGTTANNGLWLKADDIVANNGDSVSLWTDYSGNSNNAVQSTAGRKPIYVASSAMNSRPAVRLDGSDDQLLVADANILDNSAGLNFFVVLRPNNINGAARGVFGKRITFSTAVEYAYTFFFYSGNNITADIHTSDDRFSTSPITYSNSTNYLLNLSFDGSLAAASRSKIFTNGTLTKTASETSTALPNSNQSLVLGALNVDYGTYLGADYAEVIQYNFALNNAQRIIVENYLGAKYNLTIANDFYQYQAAYGHEVAGIGRIDASNQHTNSKGSGLPRFFGASGLGNNEFFIWGHNGMSLTTPDTTDVDKVTIESRLNRVWRVDETGNVGNIDLEFDVSGFSPLTPSDLRLMVDRDGDGFADNDRPLMTGTYSAGKITFSSCGIQGGDRFTLGSINKSQTPLPVTLLDFDAQMAGNHVEVTWSTLSEINNEYFTVERMSDKSDWSDLAVLSGAGNSRTRLDYQYTDVNPRPGLSYYKLKQTDFNGTFSYSRIVAVQFEQKNHSRLYPNPVSNKLYYVTQETPEAVYIYDIAGKKIIPTFDLNTNFLLIDTETLNNGQYTLLIQTASGQSSHKFLVQH